MGSCRKTLRSQKTEKNGEVLILITICSMDKDGGYNTSNQRKRPQTGFRLSREFDAEWAYYSHRILSIG